MTRIITDDQNSLQNEAPDNLVHLLGTGELLKAVSGSLVIPAQRN